MDAFLLINNSWSLKCSSNEQFTENKEHLELFMNTAIFPHYYISIQNPTVNPTARGFFLLNLPKITKLNFFLNCGHKRHLSDSYPSKRRLSDGSSEEFINELLSTLFIFIYNLNN